MAWCHQATSHYLSSCWPRSVKTRTTRTPAFRGYPQPPHDYPYYWVALDPKSKQDKVKSYKFQEFVDGWTDGQGETSIPPLQLRWEGGIMSKPLSCWNCFRKIIICIFNNFTKLSWSSYWNPSLWKTRDLLFCTFNVMFADIMTMQGASALAAIILI